MGQHGLGQINDNGERFADFCATNKLAIGGTLFPHKRIHKTTWISPDHTTENQIDHMCISKRFRRTLQDVKVRRGADINSDHHLVVARLKLKLNKNWNGETGQRQRVFNTGLLKEAGKLEEYRLTLANRFQDLQGLLEKETIDEQWKTVEAITSNYQETLGYRTQAQGMNIS
jgi:hypothetical protein